MVYICNFFFFSSRRRHTRYWRDWSSDVCSSDLVPAWPGCRAGAIAGGAPPGGGWCVLADSAGGPGHRLPAGDKIGRASCRERVRITVVDRRLKKKKQHVSHMDMKIETSMINTYY